MEKTYLERVSLRRMISPHDVAAMVAFLLSRRGRSISPANRSASTAMSRRCEEGTAEWRAVAIIGSGFIGRAWAISFRPRRPRGRALGPGPRRAAARRIDFIAARRCRTSPRTTCSTAPRPPKSCWPAFAPATTLAAALAGADPCPGEHAGDARREAGGVRRARRARRRQTPCSRVRPRRSCRRPSPSI